LGLGRRMHLLLFVTKGKFFRRASDYTIFYLKINEDILEKLKVEPVDEKLTRYKSNWLQLAMKMNNNGCQT
jgi:hypothetical protein